MEPNEKLFDAVHELPPDERDAYLNEACGSEAQRAEVEAMLADAAVADGYFANVEAAASTVAEKPGDTIGPYKLLQKIGEGGFGVVFMAEQREPIVRRVALKIIKQGMDTRQVIARFEAERQALAMMDHANVARVLDAGATDTGRPFFAMELVRGEPITEFCDAHALDTRQRLDLFLDVCSAVNHAHQKGIIHRDLKPSNILVGMDGDTPVVKVIDFGIAKAIQQNLTDKTLFTRFEQFLGTPAYVSPEQASLSPIDIDTRSDIYSLGVVLYELLAGRPPIDTRELQSAGFDEMRRLIREKEAPRPSTRLNTCTAEERHTIAKNRHTEPRKLGLLINGDLDWVVLKSLEKDRQRRYETANALAGDIRHFLSDEPVSAVAPSTAYRLRKLVARNRNTFAAATAVILALVVGLVVSIAALVREKQSRQRAENSEKFAREVSSIFQDVLGAIDPAVAQGNDTKLLSKVFDQITERVENELPNNIPEGVELRLVIGKGYLAIGNADEAKSILTTALAGAQKLRDNPKTVDALNELAQAEDVAQDRTLANRTRLLRKAIALSEETYGPDHPQHLLPKSRLGSHLGGAVGRRLAREAATTAERTLAASDPMLTLIFGNHWSTSRHFLSPRENLAMLAKLTDLSRQAFTQNDPHTARGQYELALQYYRTAAATGDTALLDEAVPLAEEADQIMCDLHQPGYTRRIEARWILAIVHLASGDMEAAKTAWTSALEEQRKAPIPEYYHPRNLRLELAWMLHRAGSTAEANEVATAFLKKKTVPPWIRRRWADHSYAAGDWESAKDELLYLTSEDVEEDALTTIDWLKLAALHLRLGDHDAYEEVRSDMVDRFYGDDTDPPNPNRTANLERTGKAYFATLPPADSPQIERALEMAGQAVDLKKVVRSWCYLSLGMAQFRTGNSTEAIASLQSAEEAAERESSEAMNVWAEFGLIALIHTYRAMAEAESGHPATARSFLAQAREDIDALPVGPDFSVWHDIVFAKLAFEEAQALIGTD